MTLKNAAADLPFGGGKSGICAQSEDLSPQDRLDVIRGFGRLLGRYRDIYNPGPDVGTSDADMKTIAIENGLDSAVSKPVDMGGNRIDQLGGAARGVVLTIREMLKHLDRLRVLPQFRDLVVPEGEALSILVQGFGAVGAHTARLLGELFPPGRVPTIVGISDASGYLYCADGLPRDELFALWDTMVERDRAVCRPYMKNYAEAGRWNQKLTFSADFDALLREDAFCLVPAAPVANYLGLDKAAGASMTVDRMGKYRMIVEGANTYSPDPARRLTRHRLERAVYRERGVLIVTDYLVNSGGVLYAAHEKMIPTPPHLEIPAAALGDREAVDAWLKLHQAEFSALAEQRRVAAERKLEEVVEHNMEELVRLLTTDPERLPWEAAEQIAVARISSQEKDRRARDVMEPIQTISPMASVVDAAQLLTSSHADIIAVVSKDQRLVGVITDRDVTRSIASGRCAEVSVESIMTREVVSVSPDTPILECVRRLESFSISATPVIDDGRAVGLVSGDLLAKRTLYRLLQAQQDHAGGAKPSLPPLGGASTSSAPR
jgi:glutamate dehydrogenase (NAD(P)+)